MQQAFLSPSIGTQLDESAVAVSSEEINFHNVSRGVLLCYIRKIMLQEYFYFDDIEEL